MQIIDISLAKA